MNLDQVLSFEKLCEKCCNSIDQNEKNNSETIIFNFLNDYDNLPQINYLLNNSNNEIALFVILEYLNKIFLSEKDYGKFMTINKNNYNIDEKTSAQQTDIELLNILINFLKKKSIFLKNMITNSTSNLISNVIRKYWLELTHPQTIFELLYNEFLNDVNNEQLTIIGLNIFDFFISNTIANSYKIGYIQFRKLISNFINIGLNSIFYYCLDLLKKIINIIVKQNSFTNLLEITTRILSNCLSFNFNLSYFEYETDVESTELTTINFPEKWALFFKDFQLFDEMILLFLKIFQNDYPSSLNILRSISRMISVRTTIFETKEQTRFYIRNMLQSLIIIVKNINPINEELYIECLEMNLRFLNNFGLKKIRKIQDENQTWLNSVLDFQIIHNSNTCQKINSISYMRSTEFWKKIIKQNNDYKVLNHFQDLMKNLGKRISYDFMNSLSSSYDIFFKDYNFNSYKRLKKDLKLFFENINEIICLNLAENLKILLENLIMAIENLIFLISNFDNLIKNDPNGISKTLNTIIILINILMELILITPPVDKLLINSNSQEEIVSYKGAILSHCFQLLQYDNYKVLNNNAFLKYQITLLIFIEKFTLFYLDDISKCHISSEIIICSNDILKHTMNALGFKDNYKGMLNIILNKLLRNLSINHHMVINYSLIIIKMMVSKMKFLISREYFKKIDILNNFTESLINLNDTALNVKEFYKTRTKIFEIIAIFSLDDFHDHYSESIDKIFLKITQNFSDQNEKEAIIKFFRDITGITNHIDVPKIFKNFIKYSYQFISEILEKKIGKYLDDNEIMFPVLDFIYSISDNKNQRHTSENNNNLSYLMFKDFSKFLNSLCHLINFQILKENGNVLNIIKTKIKTISKVWKIFNLYMKGKFINFSVFQFFRNDCFNDFLQINLEMKFLMFNYLYLYPKSTDLYLENLQIITEFLLELIFLMFSSEYISNFFLVSYKVIKNILDENYYNNDTKSMQEDLLIYKAASVIHNICLFVLDEFNMKFSIEIKIKLTSFKSTTNNLAKEIIEYIISTSLNYPKNQRIQSTLNYALFPLVLLYNEQFEEVKEVFVLKNSMLDDDSKNLREIFINLFDGVEQKYDTYNEEKFLRNFRIFIKLVNDFLKLKERDELSKYYNQALTIK